MNIVKFAEQVLDMQAELDYLRSEVARLSKYEALYHEEVRNGVEHGETMIIGLMDLVMKPGVADAMIAARETK